MVLEDPAAGLHFIRTLLRHLAGEQYKPDYFYNLTGINCVRHLFKVASSLDSLIIGEGQILSQIKKCISSVPQLRYDRHFVQHLI